MAGSNEGQAVTWFARQDRFVRALLIILAILVPVVAGMLIAERIPIRVTTSIECAPTPTDRLGKCPPNDDRQVLTYVIPVAQNRMGAPSWRVQAWSDRDGWSDLTGGSSYRVHTWVELPEVEQ